MVWSSEEVARRVPLRLNETDVMRSECETGRIEVCAMACEGGGAGGDGRWAELWSEASEGVARLRLCFSSHVHSPLVEQGVRYHCHTGLSYNIR